MTFSSSRIEIAAFGSGIRIAIFLKRSLRMGGMSDTSISSSRISCRRFQSVSDFFSINLSFISSCLSCGDDAYHAGVVFDEDDNGQNVAQPSDSYPAVFAVPLSLIQENYHWEVEHGRNINEVDSMLSLVDLVHVLIPSEIHCTDCIYVQYIRQPGFVKLRCQITGGLRIHGIYDCNLAKLSSDYIGRAVPPGRPL